MRNNCGMIKHSRHEHAARWRAVSKWGMKKSEEKEARKIDMQEEKVNYKGIYKRYMSKSSREDRV